MLPRKITLAIIDDHPVIIEGLTQLITKKGEFEIVGTFIKGRDFISFLKNNTVKIVLLDIILPDINGIDLCKEIKKNSPDTIVLAFSNHQERSAIIKMLDNGASGYLLKNIGVDELIKCMMDALHGQIVFSADVKEIIARPLLGDNQTVAKLTVREKEILHLIASGKTTPQIAGLLFLSKFTIENHRKNILQKLKVKNVAALINKATQQGLL